MLKSSPQTMENMWFIQYKVAEVILRRCQNGFLTFSGSLVKEVNR